LSDTKGKSDIGMAVNTIAPIAFNVNRESLLVTSLPPFQAGDQPSGSTTTSRYRLRWCQLTIWEDFANRVTMYWNTVSQLDRMALVINQYQVQGGWQSIASNPRILSEDDVKACIDSYPLVCHRYAANGALGAPFPSDIHSAVDRCTLGAGQWNLAGVPDFAMHHLNRVTALMEVKNPWLVTPQKIDEVLDSLVPI
jgi:hypothetical protein